MGSGGLYILVVTLYLKMNHGQLARSPVRLRQGRRIAHASRNSECLQGATQMPLAGEKAS
jgi:hypothetical protein